MYVMDLEKQIVNGRWEGHIGRVNRASIQIWTGKRFSGTRITNYYTSGSIDDTKLKVIGQDGPIYISYDEVDKLKEELESIKPPLEILPKENVFVEEKLLERVLDRVNELELKEGPPGPQGPPGEGSTEVIDNLISTDKDKALSANQGKELKALIDNIELSADKVELSSVNFISNNVLDGMNELFTNVSNGKSLIAGAITDKGVITSPSDSFSVMADNIGEISSGIELVAGDEIIYTNNTLDQVQNMGESDYLEKVIKKIKSTVSGNIRIKFNLYTSNTYTSYKSRGQIYINDIAEGVLREVVKADGTVIFSEDFDITKGDIISLKIGEKMPGKVTKNDMLTISTNVNPLFEEVTI